MLPTDSVAEITTTLVPVVEAAAAVLEKNPESVKGNGDQWIQGFIDLSQDKAEIAKLMFKLASVF